MSTPSALAEELRGRARLLRSKAGTLHTNDIHRLPLRSGTSTWIGPSADRFNQVLGSAISSIDLAVDGLYEAAIDLERRAKAIEAAALATGPH